MATTDDSPRDHAADANPALSRKRLRYSGDVTESAAMSPSKKPRSPSLGADDGDDVCVQLVDADYTSPIAIDSQGIQILADAFSPGTLRMKRWPNLTSMEQVQHMSEQLGKYKYLDEDDLSAIVSFLEDHTKLLDDQSSDDVDSTIYLKEEELFGALARLCQDILWKQDEPFESRLVTDFHNELLTAFLSNLVTLTVRVARLLPCITQEKLSRRDSAQSHIAIGSRHILLWRYVEILAFMILGDFPIASFLTQHFGLDAQAVSETCHKEFMKHAQPFSTLVTAFDNIVRASKDAKDGWAAAGAIMTIVNAFFTDVPATDREAMLQTTTESILPSICDQHPRALPPHFHETVINFSQEVMWRCGRELDLEGLTRLYKRFLQCETDAVLPEGIADQDLATALDSASDGSTYSLAYMLPIGWSLQATTRYIHSSVMEVRSTGVALMAGRLLDVYKECANRLNRLDHAIARFAARFLRTNELTKYIFSADSHATLIAHSQHIVSYLAVTDSYTNRETDIIWAACTTNVEAEFVKVSLKVLQEVSRHLSVDHMLYIAECYRDTPPDTLTAPVIDFLPELFSSIRDASDHLPLEQTLATAWISFEILRRSSETLSPSTNTLAMARIAMDELVVYAAYSSEVRLHILQRYVPHILNRTHSATTVAELLSLFIEQRSEGEEMSKILAMLPISELVQELCHYSETAPGRGLSKADILAAVTIRLGSIVHLMSRMPPGSDNTDTENLVYRLLFGNLALSNEARDAALRRLAQLAEARIGQAAQLLDRYLCECAPSLPVAHVTPALLELLVHPLMGRITADVLQTTPAQLLTHPLWLTLQKVAETACDIVTAREAINAACNLLFEFPKNFARQHVSRVVQIQQDFVHHVLQSIELDFKDLERTEDPDVQQVFLRRIDILDALMKVSFETRAVFQLEHIDRDLDLCSSGVTSSRWSFSCQIHLIQGQPLTIRVLANEDTKLDDLSEALPARTSASRNRVIVGGQYLDLESRGQETLRGLGIEPSTSILVAPSYNAFCDINHVLAADIPVHKVLSQEYHRLERFVDGPMLVAERTYRLLRNIPTPASARSRLSASTLQVQDALPIDRPWRLMLSLRILHVHLSSSVRLGIADEHFMSNIVRLLSDFIIDSGLNEHLDLTLEVTSCLLAFLREQSALEGNIAALLPSKQRSILQRLSMMMLQGKNYTSTSDLVNIQREPLIFTSYDCLLLVARRNSATWADIGEDVPLRNLIPELLLDDDPVISQGIMAITIKHCDEHTSDPLYIEALWTVLSCALHNALCCPFTCTPFFRVVCHVLAHHNKLSASAIRALLMSWVGIVTPYEHTETAILPFSDMVMVGLLELIATAIGKLKASKTPLQLDDLGTRLFEQLLFPLTDSAVRYRPLLFPESRAVAFRIIRLTCESMLEFQKLVAMSHQALSTLSQDSTKDYPGHDQFLRRSNVSAGLTNLGMTCYMNALLQQLYGNLHFRRFILDLLIVEPGRQEVLQHIQELFARMQDSSEPYIDTSPLAKSLGIEIDSQEDVHGFFAILISGLEDMMPDENARNTLNHLFSGKFVSQVRGECGHVSTRVDSFNDISITVRNKTGLHESLDEFVQGEPMQGSNKYKCLTCEAESGGRLVNAMKRTCLGQVPDNLTFCLKRFTWEGGYEDKVNDRFEFPDVIDMSRYSQQHLEAPGSSQPDIFELSGVIVHQGTLSFGHYWSYVRTGSASDPTAPKWTHLEDSRSRPVKGGVKEVQEECFGGQKYASGHERTDNAYVLLYQRKASAHTQPVAVRQPCEQQAILDQLLPTVPISTHLAEQIAITNKWRYCVWHLFQDDFAHFVAWMFDSAPEFKHQIVDSNDMHDFISELTKLASTSVLRVVLKNSTWETSVEQFLTSLGTLRSAHVSATSCLLEELTKDPVAYSNIWTHANSSARAGMSTLLLSCLKELRDTQPVTYLSSLRSTLDAHAFLWGRNLRDFAQKWTEYFAFLGILSAWGVDETMVILNTLDIHILSDLMCAAVCGESREREWLGIRKLYRADKLDLGPIFSFYHGLLQHHVDLGTDAYNGYADHHFHYSESMGVCLTEEEINVFRGRRSHSDDRHCNIIHFAYQCDADLARWKEYSPGMLVSLLVGHKDTTEGYRAAIYTYLLSLLSTGEENLNRMLCLSLHYCSARHDGPDSNRIVEEVVKTVRSWQHSEPQCLEFMQECYALAPVAVVANFHSWALAFLYRKEALRGDIIRVMNEYVLQQPNDDPTELDMTRLACVRKLVPQLIRRTQDARKVGLPRSAFEVATQVVQQIRMYLRDMTRTSSGWTTSKTGPGSGYSTQAKMKIQLDEASITRRELDQLSRFLEGCLRSSTRSASENSVDVRRNVRDESVSGDDDLDDNSDKSTEYEEEE